MATWWAAIYGVVQSQTRLKRLSSSSSVYVCQCCSPSLYPPPLSYCVHKSILCVCISIPILQIGSSVPFFQILDLLAFTGASLLFHALVPSIARLHNTEQFECKKYCSPESFFQSQSTYFLSSACHPRSSWTSSCSLLKLCVAWFQIPAAETMSAVRLTFPHLAFSCNSDLCLQINGLLLSEPEFL